MNRVIVLLLLATPALAQELGREAPLDKNAVQACRMDIHIHCSDARLRQECLVTRWTQLTDPCQDALKVPMKGH